MELNNATVVAVPPVLDGANVRVFRTALADATAAASSAIVLRGAERGVFCRGVNFTATSNTEAVSDAVETFAACLAAIRLAPRPVVSWVEGEALGGGVGIAAASDAVLATPESTFALPELLFGLAPAIVLPYLAERVTPQKLRWLALLTERLDADSSLRIGLVDRVETAEGCPGVLRGWIGRLGRANAAAIASWKRMTIAVPPPASANGSRLTREALADPAVGERLRRFAECGEPPWVGEGR